MQYHKHVWSFVFCFNFSTFLLINMYLTIENIGIYCAVYLWLAKKWLHIWLDALLWICNSCNIQGILDKQLFTNMYCMMFFNLTNTRILISIRIKLYLVLTLWYHVYTAVDIFHVHTGETMWFFSILLQLALSF